MASVNKEVHLSFGTMREVEIETPTEEQLKRLEEHIGRDMQVERIWVFQIVDDDGDILNGERDESEVVRLKEVTESAISGIASEKQITMNFLENLSGGVYTDYYGLNHPYGYRHGVGKRYIDEIKCSNELLYKATLKRI